MSTLNTMIASPGNSAEGFGYVANPDSQFVELLEDRDRKFCYGVAMNVDATMRCSAPKQTTIQYRVPAPADSSGSGNCSLTIWQVKNVLDGEIKQLEMELQCVRDQPLHSLAELCSTLTSRPAPHHAVEILDFLARSVFAVTELLHKSGRTIGLLDPGNVLYFESGTNGESAKIPVVLVLPDLFLDPIDGGIPQWIGNREHYDFIWSPEYTKGVAGGERRMEYLQRQLKRESFDSRSDLRCIARMFAWALTGKAMENIPEDGTLFGGFWDQIRDLLRGEGETRRTASLAAVLAVKGNGPKVHFDGVEPIRKPQKAKWATLFVLLVVAALGGIGGGIWHFQHELWPTTPQSSPATYALCPTCPTTSRLHSHFSVKQSPLIIEFRSKYKYPGDSDIVSESPLPLDGVFPVDTGLLKSQSENLAKQLAILEEALPLVDGDTAGEAECLKAEGERCQVALIDHFRVLHPKFDQLGHIEAKQLAAEFQVLCHRLDKLLDDSKLGVTHDEAMRVQLASNPKWEDHLKKEHIKAATRLKSVDLAQDFITMIRSYLDRTRGK